MMEGEKSGGLDYTHHCFIETPEVLERRALRRLETRKFQRDDGDDNDDDMNDRRER